MRNWKSLSLEYAQHEPANLVKYTRTLLRETKIKKPVQLPN